MGPKVYESKVGEYAMLKVTKKRIKCRRGLYMSEIKFSDYELSGKSCVHWKSYWMKRQPKCSVKSFLWR